MATLALNDVISEARMIVEAEVVPKVPGLSIAVSVDGQIVWSEEFGYADLAAKVPVTRTTRFRIGSVSKPLTAAGLALLIERGQLDLDAPVQKYILDFPNKDNAIISPRLLAGHLSGIRNYRGVEATSNRPFSDLRSALKVFENDPLEAPPRAKFSYASYNWNVLGAVMEVAAKQDFLSYMEDHVIKPLDLVNTRADRAGIEDPQRARFYETGPKGDFLLAPPVDLSYCWPAGGYLSTAEDLARFGSAHLRPGFLKPQSLKLLFTSQKTAGGTLTHYGIGWFVGRDSLFHGGDSMGGTSTLLLLPAGRTAVAMASNGGQGWLQNAMRRGKVGKDAERFLFKKNATAHKIAKLFAPLFANGDPVK